ncbi:MAG: aldehyde dehydrogenase family protein, partial [Oscillospiraceae bacterium]|nr:aldehyde dehydrogenase family protein [Oscillospiraceae bacterium]
MQETLSRQRAHYLSGATRPSAARIAALKRLEIAIGRREADILRALAEDLGKSPEEAYLTEIGMVKGELRHAMRRLRRWSLPRPVCPSIGQFPGFGRVLRDPYGVVLILSPWNYPFQLSLTPLISAVAAGNCALLRPSGHAPRTAEVVETIVRESFPPEHVTVTRCDTAAANALLHLPFDKIFFTGSPAVGREVMRAVAEHLTPVTLELSGKSPVIVAADADVKLAARRIVFGKYLNAGQTCIAPDYVLVAEPIEKALLSMLAREIEAQYGKEPLHSPDLSQIVSVRHVNRLMGLLDSGRIVCGGQVDREQRRIAPTV